MRTLWHLTTRPSWSFSLPERRFPTTSRHDAARFLWSEKDEYAREERDVQVLRTSHSCCT